MTILGIETSCDETAASLVDVTRGRFVVRSNVIASQIDIHKEFGGVVPEIAARTHVARVIPAIKKAIRGTGKPDLIAVTAGPGLLTSLAVGLETARYVAAAWNIPIVATNHLAGHLYANLVEKESRGPTSGFKIQRTDLRIQFPALGLIVSGGHTELVLMKEHGRFRLVGETRDDAAGEAFDKIAKMLGLSYPGGPALSARAQRGDSHAFDFPRAMMNDPHFDFSFSGLKTSVLYFLRDKSPEWIRKQKAHIAASVEEAIVDALVTKTIRAAKKYKVKTLLVGGGVAANHVLRDRLALTVSSELPDTGLMVPETCFATDNAAMIAVAGYFQWRRVGVSRIDRLEVDPHLPLPK